MRPLNNFEIIILHNAGLKPWKCEVEHENEQYLYIKKITKKVTRRIVDKKTMAIA